MVCDVARETGEEAEAESSYAAAIGGATVGRRIQEFRSAGRDEAEPYTIAHALDFFC